MTLQDKKAHVYRLIKLGMSKDEAELLSEMTLEEQEELDRDASYQSRCRIQTMLEERDLLTKLDDIIEQNALDGSSQALRWKLERLNPKRWGKALSIVNDPPPPERNVPDLSKLTPEERDVLLSAVCKTMDGQ